jgi:uncharacterized protein (UPF0128 family)
MPKRSKIEKDIVVAKNKFRLEIYLGLEGDDISWEIYPEDYHAALYAFSNKDKLNKLIRDKHIEEPKP